MIILIVLLLVFIIFAMGAGDDLMGLLVVVGFWAIVLAGIAGLVLYSLVSNGAV